MKKFAPRLLFFLLIAGCGSTIKPISGDYIFEDPYYYGVINKNLIIEHEGYPWFSKQYDKYEPDINQLKQMKYDEIKVVIFMGTWCHDSKREVPRMFKILNKINFDDNNINIVALKKNKKGYFNNYDSFKITNTPTFIFYKENKELGRIIERPKTTLENDLYQFINKHQ